MVSLTVEMDLMKKTAVSHFMSLLLSHCVLHSIRRTLGKDPSSDFRAITNSAEVISLFHLCKQRTLLGQDAFRGKVEPRHHES